MIYDELICSEFYDKQKVDLNINDPKLKQALRLLGEELLRTRLMSDQGWVEQKIN